MISIENLCFSYSGDCNVLENLNLRLGNAPYTCIIGPDGAGKSTLAKLVKGILSPQSGRIAYNLSCRPTPSAIGYVAEDPDDNLVGITVEDDISFGLENLGLPKREVRQRRASALQWTGLTGMENRLIQSLSGGERQKVALASMVAMGAELLICDEATNMLDPTARITLKECMRSLNQDHGTVIIETTSILSEALDADRIVLIERGKALFEGTPAEFLMHPSGRKWLGSSSGLLGLIRELNELGVYEAMDGRHLADIRSVILNLLNG